MYVNWSAVVTADVPVEVVTVKFTVPAAAAGLAAVSSVGDTTVTEPAADVPKSTTAPGAKLEP